MNNSNSGDGYEVVLSNKNIKLEIVQSWLTLVFWVYFIVICVSEKDRDQSHCIPNTNIRMYQQQTRQWREKEIKTTKETKTENIESITVFISASFAPAV